MLTSVDLQTLEASAHPSVGWRDDSWNASDPPQTEVDGQGLDLLLLSVHHRKTMKIENKMVLIHFNPPLPVNTTT